MKKVGLITIHHICNFGSVFQAYALQQSVKSLGFICEIINYKYPNEYHEKKYKEINPYARGNGKLSFSQRFRMSMFNRLSFSKKYGNKKEKNYEMFILNHLETSKEYITIGSLNSCSNNYDIFLTGSDQVWNPRYMHEDVSYLLSFTNSKNKVAFSASFGTTNIPKRYKELYKPLLAKYKHISTREQSGIKLVSDICSKQAQCTCDPTLLLNGHQWRKLISKSSLVKGKYILCYILTYTADPYPYASKLIEYVRRQFGYKVVCIGDPSKYWMNPRFKNFNDCGPLDLLNLFANASFIISSSFHGAAFSVNLKKDFYSILPPNINDERQESFLKIVGAEDRIIRVGDPMPNTEDLKVKDWDTITQKLECYRKESMNYLENALKDCADD